MRNNNESIGYRKLEVYLGNGELVLCSNYQYDKHNNNGMCCGCFTPVLVQGDIEDPETQSKFFKELIKLNKLLTKKD